MKKLPKIYQAGFNKKINNNNKKSCYVDQEVIHQESTKTPDITEALNEVFSGIGYPFNTPVLITTADKTYDTSLIAKTKTSLITIDNEIIKLSDITNIEIKKNI